MKFLKTVKYSYTNKHKGKNHSLKEKMYNVNISNLDPNPKVLLTKAKTI